jgi:decaprenylphospho-beta-D-ribofuranose 2-oxidase
MEKDGLFVEQLVGGWAGRTHRPHPVACPTSLEALRSALRVARSRSWPVIAKGAGCSYADQITVRDGAVLDCSALAGIRAFDPETGRVTVAGGTPLADVLRLCLPAGWTVSGVPGSFAVTIGGAIANNVHGKDAHRRSFGSGVRRFDLIDADGQIHRIDADKAQAIFRGVIGSLGLLGIVVEAELQLTRISSAQVDVVTIRTGSLAETLEALAMREEHDFALAWLDGLIAGQRRGRGVVWLARWSANDRSVPASRLARALQVNNRTARVVPNAWIWRAAAPMLRPPGLCLTNALYHAMCLPASRLRRTVPFADFYFLYNRISGLEEAFRPHGFAEVQAWLPSGTAEAACEAILDILARGGIRPLFAAMKGHVGDPFLLSFPGDGQSFTVGVLKPGPDDSGFRSTLRAVFEHVIAAGGRVNLSKDEFLSGDQFRRMYRGADAFLALKRRLDPGNVFQSDQYRRLFGDIE